MINDELVLSTGKRLDCNLGIIGLADGDDNVYGGYDQTAAYGAEDGLPASLNEAERRELALLMVKRWSKWGGL